MKDQIKKMHICFPIVWNGLIADRPARTQFRRFKEILSPKYKMNDSNRGEISKAVSGIGKVNSTLRDDILSLGTEERIHELTERVRSVQIQSIRDVVSAFHRYLEDCLLVLPTDKQHLKAALQNNDPEQYVAWALIAGFHYDGVPDEFDASCIDKLRTLEKETEYADAFAENTEKLTNPQFISKQDFLCKELYEKVCEAEAKKPGRYDASTLRILKEMTESDYSIFCKACDMLLYEANDYRHYFPFIISTESAELLNDEDINYAYYYMSTDEYGRLERLGLFTHQRDHKLSTSNSRLEGSIILSSRLEKGMIIRTVDFSDPDHQSSLCIKSSSITREGFKIYTSIAWRETKDNSEYLQTLCDQISRWVLDNDKGMNCELYKVSEPLTDRWNRFWDSRRCDLDYGVDLERKQWLNMYDEGEAFCIKTNNSYELELIRKEREKYLAFLSKFNSGAPEVRGSQIDEHYDRIWEENVGNDEKENTDDD